MNFIEIVKEKATELAHGAVKTSGAVVQQVKSNYAIADTEVEVGKLLKELGKTVYEAYKQGAEPDAEAVTQMCAAIDAKNTEIQQLREQINDLKNVKICSACKCEVKGGAKFCPKCGASVE